MTPEQFRRAALAMLEVVEGAHHGHADFRAHGRVIASLHPDGEQAMVKVPTSLQQRLVAQHAGACTPASGAWGRAGCTMVRLADVPNEVVCEALTEAWQFAAGAGGGAKAGKQAGKRRKAAKPSAPVGKAAARPAPARRRRS